MLLHLRALWLRVQQLEPARLAEVARLLLGLAVTTGWLTIDDARINAVASAVALVASVLLTGKVRSVVTPVAKTEPEATMGHSIKE